MKIRWVAILAAAVGMWAARGVLAQVPFYSPQATALDPVIAVAMDGVALNVPRATVTPDHKYVTLDMNPQMTTLQGIQTFTFQRPGLGFVGSAVAVSGVGASHNGLTPSLATSPAAVATTASVLDRPGMTLIAPLHQ